MICSNDWVRISTTRIHLPPPDLRGEHDKREAELRRQREREAMMKAGKGNGGGRSAFSWTQVKVLRHLLYDGIIQVRPGERKENISKEPNLCITKPFSNEYYLKENSLILVGYYWYKRIETIEVSLDTLQVIQSRGVCNKHPIPRANREPCQCQLPADTAVRMKVTAKHLHILLPKPGKRKPTRQHLSGLFFVFEYEQATSKEAKESRRKEDYTLPKLAVFLLMILVYPSFHCWSWKSVAEAGPKLSST